MHTNSPPPPDSPAPPAGNPPPPMPGVAIAALAAATGVSRFDAALGVAAVLGAVAGPVAGPKSVLGDLVDPAFHLLAVASHSAVWHRFEELLFPPVVACQKKLREWSRLTTVARLDYLQFSRLKDHTDEIVEMTKPQMYHDVGIFSPPVYPEQHVAMFRTPTFYLRAPDEPTWVGAQPEILNGHVLVWDNGAAILNRPRPGRSTTNGAGILSKELVASAIGCDRAIERPQQSGPGRVDPVKACLFISTSRDAAAAALDAEDFDLQRLLQTCVFALPSHDPCPITLKPEYLRAGYEAFCSAVSTVLGHRKNGSGHRVTFKAELSEQIEQSAAGTRNWCSGLPPRLQPFFAHTTSLPYRLAWAFLATLCPGENDRWVAPFVRATVRHVLNRQKEFLEEQMLAAEAARQQQAREIMLQKLAASGPCLLRELLRRYSVQRRELHQPVLDALMHEGMVRRRDDGRLELTGASTVKV